MKPLRLIHALVGSALFCLAGSVSAQNVEQFNGYTVHFHSFTTDILTPEVASAYDISRSPNRAMLNVSVIRDDEESPAEAVEAKVSATATNLTGQLRNLSLRKIQEGNAVYYVSEFRVNHEETLDFEVNITPDGGDTSHTINFRRKFYTR